MFFRGDFPSNERVIYPDQADMMRERVLMCGVGTLPDRDVTADPNTLVPPDGAPYFIMSPWAPGGLPTVGFALTLLDDNLLPAGGGGALTITPWRFITQLGQPDTGNPIYTSLAPVTNADYNQEFVSFDVDACAIRFQVEGTVNSPARLFIVFTEL